MNNLETYNSAFTDTFLIQQEALPNLKYQAIPTWDSVGHMQLMASLEEGFGIELEIDDIIEFSSYEKGKEILSKYGINI